MVGESFSTTCPKCGAKDRLYVVEATLEETGQKLMFSSKLTPWGFTVPVEDEDIKDHSTSNEMVYCKACGAKFSLSEVTL